jgi:Flp pilus assembly protein TadD
MLPQIAAASVANMPALHDYARGRLADSEGALGLAASSYRAALAQDPTSIEIARRSYFQALESGDMPLALNAAKLLDGQGLLPRDGTLLMIGDALNRKDWAAARTWTDRLETEVNFAFLAPIVQSWISLGEGAYVAPTIDPKDRFAALANRYVDEHVALQALARRDAASAVPAMRRALSFRTIDLSGMRLTFAAQLLGAGDKASALALLPVGEASFARARADVASAKGKGAPLTPRQGYARLIARLAGDIGTEDSTAALGVRLARIAAFADPASAEIRIAATRRLTYGGYPAFAADEARKVPPSSWYATQAQVELLDALANAEDLPGALALARTLAAAPGAESDRQVRLGRLLAETKDFAGAAAAFHAAQAGYGDDAVPWALLLFEGSALEQGGRWDEARVVLERAAVLAPNEPVILNYLGYAQVERRQNVDAALALITRASSLKPQDASISDSLGWARFVSGDVAGAVPVLERAVAGAPDDATINEHLGDALWKAGRRYEARYAWEAASTFAQGKVADRLAGKKREGMKPEYAAP